MRFGIKSMAIGLAVCCAAVTLSKAEVPKAAPDFKEVYDLVAAHLAGTSPAELNRTAVQAFVSALGPRVSLGNAGISNAPLVAKTSFFDGGIAYLRLNSVEEGLPAAVRQGIAKASGTNKLNGVVLDLRYAGGMDYAAAGGTADVFLKTERPLLDWGAGMSHSSQKDNALTMPVAILVNHQTTGGAEALAAAMRETGTALIIGSRTAGQAMMFQEFPLREGGELRIATGPIRLGNGAPVTDGLAPDINVNVSPEDERAYYADAFKDLAKPSSLAGTSFASAGPANSTNRTRRARFNEAELVRERKEGFNPDDEQTDAAGDLERPVVRDPALARALDVLRGLAVVRQSRF